LLAESPSFVGIADNSQHGYLYRYARQLCQRSFRISHPSTILTVRFHHTSIQASTFAGSQPLTSDYTVLYITQIVMICQKLDIDILSQLSQNVKQNVDKNNNFCIIFSCIILLFACYAETG